MEHDLTTPGHDAIMLWLDEAIGSCLQDWLGIHHWTITEKGLLEELSARWLEYVRCTKGVKERAETWLAEALEAIHHPPPATRMDREVYARHPEWWKEEKTREIERATSLIQCTSAVLAGDGAPIDVPPFPPLKIYKKVWEHPLTTTREYTVGFFDLMVSWGRPRLSYSGPSTKSFYSSGQGVVWDFWDTWDEWQPVWEISFEKKEVAFEVKTTIPSLGELLRQLKLYEQHFSGKIFVVAPEARFAEKIREQGFGFIQCPQSLQP
jgi:hypothetical protein